MKRHEVCAVVVAACALLGAGGLTGCGDADRAATPSASSGDAAAGSSSVAAPGLVPIPAALRSGFVRSHAVFAGRASNGFIIVRSGVRWLSTEAGIEEETSRQPIVLAVMAPRADGSGSTLVGSDGHTVYRFDDPLGPGTVLHDSRDRIRELGSVPGAVHVMPQDVYVDLATGEASDTTPVTRLQAFSIAFFDARRGVSSFVGLRGAYVTRDGGLTWSLLDDSERYRIDEQRYGTDVSTELLYRVFDPDVALPPDARWVHRWHSDPLYEALRGVPLASGAGLIDNGRQIARIDLLTGAILETIEVPTICPLSQSPDGPIAVCVDGLNGTTAHRVLEHPLALGPPTPAGFQAIAASSGGAIAVHGRCDKAWVDHALCVRQPDGTWATVMAQHPRRDGTGLAWSPDGDAWKIESVDRDGARKLLARTPPGLVLVDISEDDDGRPWILARRDDEWLAGELRGADIVWQSLDRGQHCALRGRTIACRVDDGVEVRDGFNPPRYIVAPVDNTLLHPTGEEIPIVHSMGFSDHLGFEQGELAPEPDMDDEALVGFDGWLVCDEVGPKVEIAPLIRPDEPLEISLDDMYRTRLMRGSVSVTDAIGGTWIRKDAALQVRFVDAFMPGTGVRQLLFPLPKGTKATDEATVVIVERDAGTRAANERS